MSQSSSSQVPQIKSRLGAILRATSGNFLEQFDFFLFGFYAQAIAKAFFPSENETAALLNAFGVFWLGALMRPVGAVVLGAYIDRIGRRKGLIVTLSIMAIGTVVIALCPSYATIGIAAPIIVLIARLLQGFSAGVELGGVSVYLAEIATPGNRGFYTSFQSASQQVAIFVASILGFVLSESMPAATVASWGWRIPFFVGCLIIPVIFFLRRTLEETPAFLAMKKHPTASEVFASAIANWRIVVLGMMIAVLTTTTFYFVTVYTPTFGKTVLKLSTQDALLVTLLVAVTNFIWNPVGGAVSDRIGRKPVLLAIAGLSLITAYPALHWLVTNPSFGKMLAVEMMFSFYFGVYSGTMLGCLVEIVPAHVRTTCFSLAFALAAGLFGTFTPFASTWLIQQTGDKASPGYWLMCAAALGIVAALIVYRGGQTIEQRETVAA
ncbi:MHS family citrate/tricarballylate:H+ symporter-like MFS transporter [Bradyrhizobium japonicum]|jgi:MFS transporter, MHS family, citrate/tricarballylate:H+ symporter|uniref:MHS family citrate/tricarballylate:H+ symporter-like MFS transporter n=1 Tax=Bradyrhizobium elkanii TaxID=29448 RepID=A0A4Q4KD06_BRAEL|nr:MULTISPECIES: MFS transporter [Bradyrhizobium]MBP1292962.1 MHS family citrate/tricarballylate:H+ symporter-like MFS transporter [Bradyrhizobium elkanii]MBP2431274.1 MHS family citrate/tricarballylate:H+ symporter-like MFS transporter [Bradyrhizobium elkanii]MBR1158398.1 MFS transporter [Bradyrhizobium elkanii]MCA1400918.1 MFS transporter [Bradyrhizobium sp. BRP56]MCP1735381.1 MHS family citrate/tricarballylate:H+ symporter-like MFS transporter [Bradyrhizobium elkanii]